MTTTMKIMSFAMLLVLLFSIDVVEGSGSSLCCNTHAKFGACNTYQDRKRCNKWCLDGCDNKKGGFCKRFAGGAKKCHCYC
ncbi:putative defensin-like protein 23 [Arabidopsis thaliana]|uniref:Putative defensin-like protein 23 n=4 Tax=Arabidopsis TaxID=3701 RepID=DEF23_ARATH|nr:Defensin-like (DEFL) family protein [Arabidopsis thaliana]Q2V364.1 RecName: Full=Putative defensin-like protein 23; Flags: Precursor [Arabidopsis thaliana]AED92684.1 Defensin-like (DEFL) family protein [Arabidopsis thaliana]|eukprot:NP_001031903.1 Defensin-like (DEFL) family protein [Arabidopsis thaliana]